MNGPDQVILEIARRLTMSPGAVRKNFELDAFTYSHEYLPATLNVETTTNFLVQADLAFVIVKTMGIVTDTANAFVANLTDTPKLWPFTVTWTDTGSGRDLMDRRIPLDSIVGTGQRPYYWAKPKILDANSTFTGRLLSLTGTDRNVRIAFGGYKVFGEWEKFKHGQK